MAEKKGNNIFFSSDDSVATDNSFNSSREEENFNEKNDFRNSVYHLKEQMSQFFLANPSLQEDIKFEPLYMEDLANAAENENKKKAVHHDRKHIIEEHEPEKPIHDPKKDKKDKPQDLSKFWNVLGKEIMRNTNKGVKMPPSLETVNNRLNIFRAKIDKVDYMELLSKEAPNEKKDKSKLEKPQAAQEKTNKEKQSKAQEENPIDEGEMVYYSFKKKMQLALHKRKEIEKKEKEKLQKKAKQKKEKEINYSIDSDEDSKDGSPRKMFDRNEKTGEKKDEKKDEKNIEFQSQVGQILYQTLQQSGGNTEHFRKMANVFVKNYNKKAKETLAKLKTFPPQITKFTGDDTKNLNILLPDYNLTMFIPNRNTLFQNLDEVKPASGTPEYEFMRTINKISDGKIINFWKTCQNNQ